VDHEKLLTLRPCWSRPLLRIGASVDGARSPGRRIEQGRETGKITWTEGLKLRAEQKRIARLEAEFRSDGYLSSSERRKLRTLQNDAADHIAHEKRDGWRRAWWLPRPAADALKVLLLLRFPWGRPLAAPFSLDAPLPHRPERSRQRLGPGHPLANW
jgi:hypothetical protein